MKAYAALLRAINVGGTGKLPMAELRDLCSGCGFTDVGTYIQSGNVVFRSKLSESGVKRALEQALARKLGKPFGAFIRTAAELDAVLGKNPFPEAAPARLLVLFLDAPPPPDSLDGVIIPGREELALRGRELFLHFPDGMGQSKLSVPLQRVGTARNLNTVTKLAALVRALA
jgi:uncharacterized protein (DUF1697 family)